MENKLFKTTEELVIPDKVIDQVLGQEEAVNLIKKAARQRRHVLLIGEPGTGKSMLGLGLAELLPKETLVDVLAIHNPNDENQPLIRTVPAGAGRNIVSQSIINSMSAFRGFNLLLFILLIVSIISPWWVRSYYLKTDGVLSANIMFATFFIGSMIFLAAYIIFTNLNRRMQDRNAIPKLIVDNYKKEQAPFFDATGAHAGALLGDVLHDPLQCFYKNQNIITDKNLKIKKLNKEVDRIIEKDKNNIVKKDGYEAVYTDSSEQLIGEIDKTATPVNILSCNKHNYNGLIIKIKTEDNNEVTVSPEHKIAVWKHDKIDFIKASEIKKGVRLVTRSKTIIIDEEDIINSYCEKQVSQSKLYKEYLDIKEKNVSFGYKRISRILKQDSAKTRWWHSKRHTPVPIKTIESLKQKGLIPLKTSDKRIYLIAKVLGALYGDGGIFENLNGIFLSSKELEAVKEFGVDLAKIFGPEVKENERIIEGGEKGHSWCYQNTNRKVIRFFKALGAPIGNKTKLNLKIPDWIYLKQEYKDEFFGSFMGSELGSPNIHKEKNRLNTLDVSISGTHAFEQNRIEFLTALKNYLEEKGVLSTSIQKSKIRSCTIYRLMISIKFNNVVKFIKSVKINYCEYKQKKLINAINEFRKIKKAKFNELIKRGYGAEHAMKVLNLNQESLYLILNDAVISNETN